MSTPGRKPLPAECESNVRDMVVSTVGEILDIDITTPNARRAHRRRSRFINATADVVLAVWDRFAYILVCCAAIALVSTINYIDFMSVLRAVFNP